jgi:hypothetical protein
LDFPGRPLTASPQVPFFSWEAQGRNAAPLLEKVNAVVIAASDPAIAASFALGVARVQGSVRRVAIADLVGEVAPLQALVTGEDSHGISDSFLYGVSLNKIAQPLEGSANVFLMPSGTEPVAIESVYNNDRWRKLAAGFQQVGALLIIVAVANAPGFAELCAYVGAVFPVGDPAPSVPPGVTVIALPRPTPRDVERVVKKAQKVGSEDAASRRYRLIAIAMATIGVSLLVGILWPQIVARLPGGLAQRLSFGTAHSVVTDSTGTPADSAGKSASTRVLASDTSAIGAAATAASTKTADSATAAASKDRIALVVANPADSAKSAAYAVYLGAASTPEEAVSDPRVRALPAVSITPVVLSDDGVRWYRTLVGASNDEATAVALLARIRNAKLVGPTSGNIVRAPYSFLLEQGLAAGASADAIAKYATRGVWAYALKQADGKVTIFTGAHESVAQAAILAESLRTAGIAPVLVFRTGRAF